MTCDCGSKMHRCRLRPSRNGGVRCWHCDTCEGVIATRNGRRLRESFGRVAKSGDRVVGHAVAR